MQQETFRAWFVQQVEAIVEKVVERWVNNPPGLNPWGRFGTVTALDNGKPVVKFDWDDEESSGRTYPFVASYSPVVGDRVFLQRCGGSWIVVGKVNV